MDASRVVTVYLVSVVLWTVPGFQSAAVMPPSAQQRRHRGARAPQDAGRSARLLLREMLLASPPVSDRDQDQALRPREDLKDAVVPHDYMVSIYRTYSAAEKLGLNSSFFLSSKSANTITSFVDRGTGRHGGQDKGADQERFRSGSGPGSAGEDFLPLFAVSRRPASNQVAGSVCDVTGGGEHLQCSPVSFGGGKEGVAAPPEARSGGRMRRFLRRIPPLSTS
ncbi:unnamed protein product [Merluccius merluccius]